MIDVSRRRAFSRVEMATSAKCSRLVPYRCMCRCARTANICPGPIKPAGWMKFPSGVGGAEYCAPGFPLGAKDAPKRLTDCCSDMRLTTHSAIPDATAAAASPTEPAAPPPPPVSIAVKRTSGMPITCANNEVSPPSPNE